MSFALVCFWLPLACVVYTYLVYPLLLAGMARHRRLPVRAGQAVPTSVSVVVAAHNEEAVVDARLQELTHAIAAAGLKGEVILVSDGSTDDTVPLAQAYAKRGVQVVELPSREGKAVALSRGYAAARYEIIVFADARQTWEPLTLKRLLANFADPSVGAVSGDLVVEEAPGLLGGVGLYWRYEKWLRQQECAVHSTVGVTGAISAVRRRLFRPIPRGTILDDVYWPLHVVMQGFRVVHDARARAYDRLPERTADEFARKVRTLSGNCQLVARLPAALVPWRNPIWWQFISHKLLRLLVPWALLLALAASVLLSAEAVYRAACAAQITFYVVGLIGIWKAAGARFRPARDAAAFLVLNGAAWLSFWVWAFGRTEHVWRKVSYQEVSLRRLPAETAAREAAGAREPTPSLPVL
jgi:cellulose synthase/poly-beta-1,6-N-acetylglucosamine synthase-like glycosyltransferase